MGKKSLIKSTAKKKTTPKKEGGSTTKKAATKTTKKAAAKTTKKAATKKTTAKTTKKATAKAAKPVAKAKKLSLKELTFLKFEPVGTVPDKLAAPQPAAAVPTAPPLITAQDAAEADRLHALLAKKFSMDEVKAAAKAPVITAAKAAPKAKKKPAAKKLSVQELIFLKFEPVGTVPDKLPASQPAAAAPTAPPLITAQDTAEADRLHALLAKKFSMDEVKAAAKAPAEKTSPAAAPEAPATEPEQEAPTGPAMAPEAWIAKDQPEAEPVAEAAPPETTEAQTEPAPQSAAAEPPAPEPRPVMKPAMVARKTIVTAKPAAGPDPEKESPAVAAAASYAVPESQSDPVVRSAKIAAAAAALLILILLAVSAGNSGKFYIKSIDNAVEIWKGDFSPKDRSFYMVLHGVQAPEPQQSVYSKKDVFPIIFDYYLAKSDTLLDVEGLPDFEGIKHYLHEAQDYAITSEMKSAVEERLNTIDRMVLLYKADVAISRNTEDSLESAVEILEDAGRLTSSAAQDEEISEKIDLAREKMKALKTPAPAPEADTTDEVAAGADQHATE